MTAPHAGLELRINNILVATDFSTASKGAVLYGTATARRHNAKVFIAHVVTSSSESALMAGWRAGQTEIIDQLLADRLDGVRYELVVKSGQVGEVLSRFIRENAIDLVVVGTRGRTGVLKFLLGSVAENIFREVECPVLTVGPNVVDQNPEIAPERILTTTGFSVHSVSGVQYAIHLAQNLHASLALLHVVTEDRPLSGDAKARMVAEARQRLRGVIPPNVQRESEPLLLVEFGSAVERVLQTATEWNANLIVLGLRSVHAASPRKATWAIAHEIVSNAHCAVLTVRMPE